MDLDGFIRLDDQQIKEAQAQVDMLGKLVSDEVVWQQAVKGALENWSKALGIQWSIQSHDQLIRTMKLALQHVRKLENNSERLRLSIGHVTALLRGGADWEAVRDGWLAFNYLSDREPISGLVKIASVPADQEIYDPRSWMHPTHAVPEMPESHDPGSLLQWAKRHTCYPKWGLPAYVFLGAVLQTLSDAAATEAAAIQSRLDAAKKEALDLEQRDWDRLKATA